MPDHNKRLFISYSSKDREFVSRVASDLKSYGVDVWWDKWEMKVGDSINKKIQGGISSAGWLAVILSRNSVKSLWVEREISAALVRELELKDIFVLPILYEDCEIPLFLRDKVYADFRQSFSDGLSMLLARVKPAIDPVICSKLMSEEMEQVRSGLSKIPANRKKEYLDWLVGKLESTVNHERRGAMMALYLARYEHLPTQLLKLAKDSSKSNRRQAVFYLGELQVDYALQIVTELTQDESPDVRAAARDALKKLGR